MGRAGSHGGRRSTVRVVVGAVVLGAAVACSSSPTPSLPAPRGSTLPAPTSAPSTAERGAPALSAYRGMWQDFAQAGKTADWRSSGLGQHATGVALTNMSRALYADHLNGFVTKGEPRFDPRVQSIDPTSGEPVKVIVTDCADSTQALKYYVNSGKPVGGGGGRSRITGIVEKQSNGSWKVSDYAVQDLGSC